MAALPQILFGEDDVRPFAVEVFTLDELRVLLGHKGDYALPR